MTQSNKKFLLKDHLFNRKKVESIAFELQRVHPTFQAKGFVSDTVKGFKERELKARISWMAEMLKKYLPPDYRKATKLILKSLPPPADPSLSDGDFGDFIYAPYNEFVFRYGCNENDLEFSLQALYQLTQRFSAEDAIRYFINAFPDRTMEKIHEWKYDSHYHVRRLCSEGLRPKLPWAKKIGLPLESALPVLDELFADSTRFVTRSVANHMNDISKEDPSLVVKTLLRWKSTGRQKPEEMAFIINHSLRGLIKQGHPEAMKLLGYAQNPAIRISDFTVPGKARIGSSLAFELTVHARKPCDLIIDYLIYFRNKVGELNRGKVFKLKRLRLDKGEEVHLRKTHQLQANMTTRTLYPGEHMLELQINGQSRGKRSFEIY